MNKNNRPVLLIKGSEMEEIKDCQIFLPITKNFCISLTDEETSLYEEISKDETDIINSAIFNNNGRYIYASSSIK